MLDDQPVRQVVLNHSHSHSHLPRLAPQSRRSTAEGYAHILIPTTLSASEHPAVRLGLQLAAGHETRVTLLHVLPFEASPTSVHWMDAIDKLHRALSPDLRSPANVAAVPPKIWEFLQREIPDQLRSGVDIHAEGRQGDFAEEVVRFAARSGVDLIILCTELSWNWLPVLPPQARRVLQLARQRVALVGPCHERRSVQPTLAGRQIFP
jgi:nucleotide-binding universal stress UspA family protein